MIELKDLTEKERINISIQCEPFFLVSNKTKVFTSVYNELMKHFSKKYSKEVWLVVTALVKATKYGNKGTRFSLSKQNYVVANRVHKQKLSLDRVRHVIETLDKEGFVTYYKGFRFSSEINMTTCLMMRSKFSDLLDANLAKKFGMKRDPLGYIEVKDKDDKRVLLSIKDFRGYSTLTKFMDKYNTLLSKNIIMMPDEDTGEMLKCSTVYKRVFSGDLDSAGRFYEMGNFQVMKSKYRKFMTINGEGVSEVDYSNLHPRMLYTLEGVVLEDTWDAYDITELQWVCDNKKDLRTFLKSAYLAILFSKDIEEATSSVLQKANKDKSVYINTGVLARKVVDAVLNKNKVIQHYFFEERLWAKLQNMDSRLATHVIDWFTKKDIVCLGWHDSFCVPDYCRVELIEAMKKAWYGLFGSYNNFKCEVEF